MDMQMEQYWSSEDILNAGKRKEPTDKFLAYLKKFQADQLTAGTPQRHASYSTQRDALVDIIKSQYSTQGLHQTIKYSGSAIPNFWELLFALHHLTNDIKLTNNLGYYREAIGAGIYAAGEQPYAEFTVIGTELTKILRTNNPDAKKHKASLSLNKQTHKLTLNLGRHNHLVHQFKNGKSSGYLSLLKLYTCAGEPQTRAKLIDPSTQTLLKDVPKNIGLKGVLREWFIENTYIGNQPALVLHKSVALDENEYERLRAELVKS